MNTWLKMRITGVEGLKGGGVRDGRYMNRKPDVKIQVLRTTTPFIQVDFNHYFIIFEKDTHISSGVPL